MYAGMVARAIMQPLLRIPVTVSIASEFRYEEPLIDEKSLVIIISQSGRPLIPLRLCGWRTDAVLWFWLWSM